MQPAHKRNVLILLVVAAAFAALIVVKIGASSSPAAGRAAESPGVSAEAVEPVDPVAAYQAALDTGRPIFLNFGLSYCANCAEMERSVQEVMPDYKDKVVYLHVMTDEPSGQALARRFSFQFVPTSYFIGPGGEIADSYTGKLDAAGVRMYLDALVTGR